MSCSKCRHSDVALEAFRAQVENLAWQLWFLVLYNDHDVLETYMPETHNHQEALRHVYKLSDWARREYVARGVDSQVTREVRVGMTMYDLDNNRPPAVEPSLAGIITAAQSVAHLMRGEQCECRREVNDHDFVKLFPWSADAEWGEGPEADAYANAVVAAAHEGFEEVSEALYGEVDETRSDCAKAESPAVRCVDCPNLVGTGWISCDECIDKRQAELREERAAALKSGVSLATCAVPTCDAEADAGSYCADCCEWLGMDCEYA